MIQESSFCNHSLRVWMRYRVTLTKAFEWSLYVNVLLFCDAWWMQHSVPEICWLDPSTFRRASMSYTHLIPAGEHYYCLSACVRNSPVTLLRKSRVNEAAGSKLCFRSCRADDPLEWKSESFDILFASQRRNCSVFFWIKWVLKHGFHWLQLWVL